MFDEITRDIFIALVTAIVTLISTYLVYRNQRRSAQAAAEEAIATSATKITETAIEQLNYLAKVNAELRDQKCELEKAFDEARRNYSNALASIERMESEYRLAVDNLVTQYNTLSEELRGLKEKYNLALQEITMLKARIASYEIDERKTGS